MISYIFIAAGILLALHGAMLYFKARKKIRGGEDPRPPKKQKSALRFRLIMMIVGSWLVATGLLQLFFGKGTSKIEVDIMPARTGIVILGYDVSESVLTAWIVMAVVLILALLLRIFVIPRFRDEPRGVQALLEALVGWIEDFAAGSMKYRSGFLNILLFTIAVTLGGYGIADLAGLRSPASDPTFTLTLAFMIYIVTLVYSVKNRRRKFNSAFLDGASAVVRTGYKFVSGISTPVSMACRLFGNMISGTIIMNLIYSALGSAALGLPDIIALYFGVFSAVIQTFIFMKLTLTYVSDNT